MKIKQQKNKGYVLMTAILLFVLISLTIVFGVTEPIIRQLKVVRDTIDSKRSYYIAEALTEDMMYRLNNSLEISTTETLNIDNSYATATIASLTLKDKTITVSGDTRGLQRNVKAAVTVADGVSFNYGIQTGNGGFFMANNSTVVGNVYSNGNISGGNVTGTAIAANSLALSTDQENATPATPPLTLTFGTTTSSDLAQSFTVTQDSPLNNVELYLRRTVSQPGTDITVRIMTDNGDKPSSTVLVSKVLLASQLSTSYDWEMVTFPTNPSLIAGQKYWLVLDVGSDASKYYTIGSNTGTYSNGSLKKGTYNSSWATSTHDIYFKVSLGGINSTINDVDVAGNAWAHTITSGSVSGTKYCQVGSGCNTSRPDPAPQAFPISDVDILDWKATAADGGIIGANVTPAEGSTIGPGKITGNLTISNNFRVGGYIWVVGNIVTSNGKVVTLDPSFGTNDGIMIVDGTVDISNNSQFNGSGVAGSYMLILTTNTGSDAIEVSNNAGAVILNAQKGTINFANNASAKEATANSIVMANGAEVAYESGLIDLTFDSGPSGSWGINGWQETE